MASCFNDAFYTTISKRSGHVNIESAVSTDVGLNCPSTSFQNHTRMLLRRSHPIHFKRHAGQECSRTHNGFSDSTPHDAYSSVFVQIQPAQSAVVHACSCTQKLWWTCPALLDPYCGRSRPTLISASRSSCSMATIPDLVV